MSILSYLFKNSTIRLAVYGLGITSAFIVTPHILHTIGDDVYGIWVLISTLSSYFIVCNFANSGAISAVYAKACANKDALSVQSVFIASLQFAIFSFFCTILISFIYYLILDKEYLKYINEATFILSLLFFTCSIAISTIVNISHGFLAGKMKWNILAFTSMFKILYTSVSMLIFLRPEFSVESNFIIMSFINSSGMLVESIFNFSFARKYFPKINLKQLISNPMNSNLYKVSKGLSITIIGSVLRNSTQIYLVGAFLSVSSVTVYALTKQLIGYMNDLMASAFGIMNPYFSTLHAQNNTKETQHTLLVSIFLSYGMSSIVSLGLVFYGELFFVRWLGEDFSAVYVVLVPMALAGLLELGPLPNSGFLIGASKQDMLAKMTIFEGIATTGISIPALFLYGLEGVGWAIFVSSLFFRTYWMPSLVCRFSGLSFYAYYKNVLWALVPVCIAQYAYYTCIKVYVVAEYTSIILAGFGQGIVALITIFLVSKICKFEG